MSVGEEGRKTEAETRAVSHQQLEKHEGSLSGPSEEHGAANTSTWNFWAVEP